MERQYMNSGLFVPFFTQYIVEKDITEDLLDLVYCTPDKHYLYISGRQYSPGKFDYCVFDNRYTISYRTKNLSDVVETLVGILAQ